MVKLLLAAGAENIVDSKHKDWIPTVIDPLKYYQLESDILKIINTKDRFILTTKDRTFVLMK